MEMGHQMMAYGTPLQSPLVSVVGDCFCVPYLIDLSVKKAMRCLSDTRVDVRDVTGNLLFQTRGSLWQLNKKRTMRDPAGFPVVTQREKALSCRHRWTVHRGESSDAASLLYSVQRSHPLQMKTRLDVFLPGNVRADVPDFQVKDNFKLGSFLAKGHESFGVRVYPGVDYAFIVSLLVILNENDIF
nr:protein LURP-one-related 14-like [Ipomoea batatas]